MTAAHIAFLLSGVAGLGYEIVWTRMFAIGLGHEIGSMHAVLGALFAGFAVGAWTLDGRISRSARPGAWYAALELLIGLWAVGLRWLIPRATEWALVAAAEATPLVRWMIDFGMPAIVLLPATAAMGATLPAMERLCSRLQGDGRVVGGLYALNTLGAVAGTLLSTFVLVPRLGYGAALLVLASINVACGVWILVGPARHEAARAEPAVSDTPCSRSRLALTLVVTGALGIGYQVLGVRVMTQVLESTVFTFAAVLSVYLLGTAVGAGLYQRFMRAASFDVGLGRLLAALATACGVGVLLLRVARPVYRTFAEGGLAGSVLAEMMLAAVVFGPPTLLMGATFSHLAQAARRSRGGIGWALALNTAGAALAPVVFGQWLLPRWGSRLALVAIPVVYMWLLPRLSIRRLTAPVATIVILTLVRPNLILVDTAPGETVIAAREGAMSTAVVVERGARERLLKVNDRFTMGGTGRGLFLERRLAHIPLLLHPHPESALVLGLGTGITCATAVDHPALQVDGVELLAEVVDLLPEFEPANAALWGDRATVHVADARRFVRATTGRYDVIIADLFHPARDGAGSLYTAQHFSAVAARLEDDGLFCQWLPLYQLDGAVLRVVVRTYMDVFPNAIAVLGYFNVDTPVLGLLGGGPRRYDADYYRARVTDLALVESLLGAGIRNRYQLFGCYAASTEQLLAYAGAGPLNSDDHPVVTYAAPRATYAGTISGAANLMDLLDAFAPRAADIIEDDGTGTVHATLDGYLGARDRYLRGLVRLHAGETAAAMTEFIASVHSSPEFRTAYEQLMELARMRMARDPEGARAILDALIEAVPRRDEARLLRRELAE